MRGQWRIVAADESAAMADAGVMFQSWQGSPRSCSSNYPNLRRWSMGDKSPKSNERRKKQDAAEKNQKKANAIAKAHPAPAVPGKKGR
jgi:hypothetical protein